MPLEPVVRVAAIRKTYGRPLRWTRSPSTSSTARSSVSLVGLIGPNGAGKTTTMECVEGLHRPDRGAISVLGLDPVRDVHTLQHRIGVQLQEAQLQKRIKVREAVGLWASLYQKPVDGDRLLQQLGLSDKRDVGAGRTEDVIIISIRKVSLWERRPCTWPRKTRRCGRS